MKGSIVTRTLKDGRKRYDAVFTANGKQRWKTFHRRRDAEGFLTSQVKQVQEGSYLEVHPILMDELFDRWLTQSVEVRLKTGRLKLSSVASYRSVLGRHLRPAFGALRSDRFRPQHISEWVAALAERMNTGKLSAKSFNYQFTLLHTILAWARHPAQGYLAHDPLIGQQRVPQPRTERAFLEPHEIEQLLKAASPPHETVIHLAAFTGLRKGELFGLQWGDIDWQGSRIFVRRSIVLDTVTTPKTEGSYRTVDVTQRTLEELRFYQTMFPPIGDGFIFRTADGRCFKPASWCRGPFARIVKAAGIQRITLHALRHTYVSLLTNQGEHLKYVSRQVGHSSTKLTADLYSHLFGETSRAAMDKLATVIPGKLSNAHLIEVDKTGSTSLE